MNRLAFPGLLVVAAGVLTALYGPVAIALVALAGAATYLGRFYPPLPTARSRDRIRRWRRSRRRGHEGELRRRRADLEWALRDRHQADALLRPGLARAAEALLRGRTGSGLADDSGVARDLLGPELDSYLASRRGEPPTAAQLDVMLTRLEALR